MKKMITTMAIALTMAVSIFAGTAAPVSACDYTPNPVYYSYSDYVRYVDCSRYATVCGTKHFLAVRTYPSYDDANIMGKLYNGATVYASDQWSGDYVWVYSPGLQMYGWVNGSYLY